MDWEKKFDSVALGRGMTLFQDGKVVDLKHTQDSVSACVNTIPRYEVSAVLKDGIPSRMKCQCPKYRSGRNCEHIAAVLYALYGAVTPTREAEKASGRKEQEARKAAKEQEAYMAALREEARRAAREKARKAAEEEVARERARIAAEEEAAREETRKIIEKAQKAMQEARKVLEESRKADEEEAAREQARKEARERIAQREAEKKAKKAERKKKRQEAEQAARAAAEEEAKRKAEEEKRKQEEEEKRKAEEELRRQKEAAEELAAKEEAARKKEEKIKAAIERKARQSQEPEELQELQEETALKVREVPSGDSYCYYDFPKLKEELQLQTSVLQKGRELFRSGLISMESVNEGYLDNENELVAEIKGVGKVSPRGKNQNFEVKLLFSRDRVFLSRCECQECRRNGFYWYGKSRCAYIAGLLGAAEDYIRDQQLGDATDKTGSWLLHDMMGQHARQVMAVNEGREESLKLEPRLISRDGRLSLSFRVGEGRLYVIKDFFEFCDMVKNSKTGTYGTNTQINHQLSNFTRESRKWYGFISKLVKEEEELERRIEESIRYSRSGKCSDLELYGWRLDQFYEELGDGSVEYEDRSQDSKTKDMLRAEEGNPKLTLQISKYSLGKKKEFHGIKVYCRMPEFYQGVDTFYYIEKGVLCRMQADCARHLEPLWRYVEDGRLQFNVGRRNLSEFYYSFLPGLQEYVDIAEQDSEEIHSYLPPQVSFVFYLDVQNHNMTCRISALYGEREVSSFDMLYQRGDVTIESFRLRSREEEIIYHVRQYFPQIDYEKEEFNCGGDEELMYIVLSQGVEELLQYGEVKCTQRFKNMNLIRFPKVSVGVSMSQGLLDLEITTQDISREELLEILKSFRLKKRFYRLKNGDFLNMENETLKMLSEMVETMHLSPKEFIKGKVHLPAYRTLYLDKILEEREGVYLTRDSRFREMVKSFKTINDADYEEPAQLSGIMRGYQKNGYKWFRTLESCGFGGILADDMGLGKTLQMIAVFLAAKQEGTEGCSLVVCPSSLVFNWAEEFRRFAPDLHILTVTGTQEQRRELIESCSFYDVLITSYDLLKRDISYYEELTFTYEVLDEAQYIKNHTTAAAKAVKVIQSRNRFALTGTPVENRLSELWSIFDYLMPGFLYGYDVFKREFETPISKNGDEDAMKRLQRMTGPFILRRLKKDVLKDLPDKLEEIRYVQLEDAQRQVYDAQVVHMQTTLAKQSGEDFSRNKLQVLAELTRLRQICCDPALCYENYRGESAKREACLELIQSAIDGGHKILLFSQFTTMLGLLKESLDREGISYFTITGDTPKEERLRLVKAFNENDTPLFLISLKAGGVGLNLTGADVVIHYDPWWNLAAQDQATDRAHRIGQTKKVTVYKLIVRNTVEEKILKLQEAKRGLADSIVNAQTGQLASLSKEELLELLEA